MASVPIELNTDQQRVIDAAQATAFVSIRTLVAAYGWTEVRRCLRRCFPLFWAQRTDAVSFACTQERCRHVLDPMLAEGIIWVDEADGETLYYFTSLWFEQAVGKTS